MTKQKIETKLNLKKENRVFKEIEAVINFMMQREYDRDAVYLYGYCSLPHITREAVLKAYTNGLCGNLALILHGCFPRSKMFLVYDGTCVWESNGDHVYTKIGEYYYDIKGVYNKAEIEERFLRYTTKEVIQFEELKASGNMLGVIPTYYETYTKGDIKAAKQFLKEYRKERDK